MKKILLVAAAATMMVACGQTEKLNNDLVNNEAPRVIGFNTISEKATRAGVIEDLELYHKTFAVWSTKESMNTHAIDTVFNGDDAKDIITFDSVRLAPNHWTYNPYRYWDRQAEYSFVAVAPNSKVIRFNKPENVGDNTGTFVTVSADGYTLIGQNLQSTTAPAEAEIKVGFDGADGNDTDLMTSGKIGRKGSDPVADVNLSFKHILAKLNVSIAKDPVFDNVKVVIKSVKVTGLDDNGVYFEATSDNNSAWRSALKDSTYALSWVNANGIELPKSEVVNNKNVAKPLYFIESLVMPQSIEKEVEKLAINYTIVTETRSENYDYVLALQDSVGTKVFDNFQEQNNYTIKLTVKPNVITFDASSEGWNDIVNGDHDIIVPNE